MANSKQLLKKIASANKKPTYSSSIDDMFGENSLVLNKNTPTQEEYKKSNRRQPYTSVMNYKKVEGDSNYTWVDSKGTKIEKAPQQEEKLELRSKELGKNISAANTNTQNWNPDFPGMGTMQAPTPADGPGLATGNGRGGEIFPRSQIKWSSIKEANEPVFESGERITKKPDLKEVLGDIAGNIGEKIQPYTPWGAAFNRSQSDVSRSFAITQGAVKNGLAGMALGGLYNLLKKKYKVVQKEVYNPETGEMEIVEVEVPVKTSPFWKDVLISGTVGAGLGGLLGDMSHFDHKWRNPRPYESRPITKISSEKKAFASFGQPDILSLLNSKIMADSSLDFEQRRALMNYIQTLPNQTLARFAPIIGTLFGAGAGVAIAKKLLGWGIGGSVLAGIIGGVMGNNISRSFMSSTPSFNPLQGSGFISMSGRSL